MKNDPIVEEVRCTKEKLAAKFNYDLGAIFADAEARQRRSRHRVARLKPVKPKPLSDRV